MIAQLLKRKYSAKEALTTAVATVLVAACGVGMFVAGAIRVGWVGGSPVKERGRRQGTAAPPQPSPVLSSEGGACGATLFSPPKAGLVGIQ